MKLNDIATLSMLAASLSKLTALKDAITPGYRRSVGDKLVFQLSAHRREDGRQLNPPGETIDIMVGCVEIDRVLFDEIHEREVKRVKDSMRVLGVEFPEDKYVDNIAR